jgi:rifampicin phosphotransferase
MITLPLSSTEATLLRTGGKGANLAELTRAGFNVPPGFLVTTDAYRAFVEANDIRPRLLALVQPVQPDDPVALDAVSAEIRALFAAGHVPPEIQDAICAAYEALSTGTDRAGAPVAVRSSATAEDLPGLSFAGQQDTYLNIVGGSALVEASRKCWGSLWTARAMGYRARNHIPPHDVALAVVVQQMILSEVSGVMFTANPLTGRRDEIVIDASYGLGEAIVSGQVEPDNYAVDTRGWQITRRKLGAKALAIVPNVGGGTQTIRQEGAAQRQALTDEQILELARLGQQVAAHFGSPQDVEWALAGGQIYLLQSRPVTSLYPLPPAPDGEPRVYFSFNSAQGVPEPFTPLGSDMLRLVFGAVFAGFDIRQSAEELAPSAGGRMYMDATALVRDPRTRRAMLTVLTGVDPGARQALIQVIEAGQFPTKRTISTRRVLAVLGFLGRMLPRVIRVLLKPELSRVQAISEAELIVDTTRRRVERTRTLDARVTLLQSEMPHTLQRLIVGVLLKVMFPGMGSMVLVERLLVSWLKAEPGAVLPLVRGLPGNVTTEMDLRLWGSAQTIRANAEAAEALRTQSPDALAEAYRRGRLPGVAQRTIAQFLEQYGMRGVGEIDMGRTRWRENPTQIIQTLKSYLQIDKPDLAPDRLFRQGAEVAEQKAAEYVAQVRRTRFGAIRGRVLAFFIRRMRTLTGFRESPKYYIIRILDLYRTALLDSARDLVKQGSLERPDDIFFVPVDTLKRFVNGEAVDLKAVVTSNRAEYERECARKQIPRLLLSTGETYYAGLSDESSTDLVGDGVSPGVVEGPVRVVLDPYGVRLEPGEILVCPATDPGWTPLFLSAGGLIMELGGLVTHGSVVAREYGIPAVVGVHQATTRLHTGQRIRVDGSQGRITLLDGVDDPGNRRASS